MPERRRLLHSPDPDAAIAGVDFWIDDADTAAAKAPALGGSVLVPAHDTPGFRNAVLADPHGAVFSVSQLLVEP